MNFSLAISTCPNDTFIFAPLILQLIDNQNFKFSTHFADIEKLNESAFENKFDITKVSYAAYFRCADEYEILDSGSALGFQNGPILISKQKIYPDELEFAKIAIPGKFTTAAMLLKIFFPKIHQIFEYLFSNIEEAILSNEVDAGVIIHENRFSYQKKGLRKICDLGEIWENSTHLPIPLGAIVIRKTISREIKLRINEILKKSVHFALEKPDLTKNFIKNYAQNLENSVIENHIRTFVNEFTEFLNEKARKAIEILFEKSKNFDSKIKKPNFLTSN